MNSDARALLRRPVTTPLHPLAIALWERDVTYGEFAAALGVSERAIKGWTSWSRRPRKADRERLAAVLGGDYFPPREIAPSKSPRTLRPLFKYFGAKHRIAAKYPPPEHSIIVEPFAGSAAYATLHHDRDVILVEKDPTIAGLWRYLIRASASEIGRLPLLRGGQTVDDLRRLPPEARSLIGFWLRTGSPTPRTKPSSWAKNPEYADRFWGPEVRERVAASVELIRHWRVIEGDYSKAPEVEASWFIDPPYQRSGDAYEHGPAGIDYRELARWVHGRKGLSIVCEQEGARWLPFRHFADGTANASKKGDKISREVAYVTRSTPERTGRSEVGAEQIAAILRALGVDRKTAAAMAEARETKSRRPT